MSSFIQFHNIHFSFENLSTELISGISGSFHPGWTSLCGPNGCGKTTLMKLITRELQPNSGKIRIQGRTIFVPQSTIASPPELEEFRFNYQSLAIQLRLDLGIQDNWYDRWESLSIGERKRLQIAVALSAEPDVLLVDEPTNHLDNATCHVVLNALQNFHGTGILISHDRLLLNQLCQYTAFLEFGSLRIFSSSYDIAKKELEAVYALSITEKNNLRKEHSKLSQAVQHHSEKIAKGRKKLSKRGLNPKDHDAKSKINLARLTGADNADTRKKQLLSRKQDRMTQELSRIKTKKTYDLGVFFEKIPKPKRLIFAESTHSFNFLKISHLEVVLEPGDKLAITGANGVGKSTLLKKWIEKLPEGYTYGPQEFSQAEIQSLTDKIGSLDKTIRGKILTLVSCFGSDPKSIAAGSIPSPGVWQKLIIAQAIVQASPMLILDEPTNHMDLSAIEVLEEALQEYQGTLICISHDADFIKGVCNLQLNLERLADHTEAVLLE